MIIDRRISISIVIGAFLTSALSMLGLNRNPNPAILSALLFFLVAVLLTERAFIRRRSLFDNPVYLAFYSYVFFLGFGPLVARMIDPSWSATRILTHIGKWPLILSWIGLAALGLGYWCGRSGVPHRGKLGSTSGRHSSQDVNYLLYGAIAFTLVGVSGVFTYLSKVGGLTYLLDTSYGTRENPSIYAGFYNMLRPGLFLLVAFMVGSNKRSVLGSLALLLYILFDLLWLGPLSGSRSQIITLVLTLAYIAKYCGSVDRASGSVLRGLLTIGVLVALAWGGLRTRPIADILVMRLTDVNITAGAEEATMAAFYQPFDSFVRVVDLVPGYLPYQWGKTFYESLTVFIPRDLWKSKPSSVGDWLTETLYDPHLHGNSVATWPGELYLDFGAGGVVLGMIVMGMVCAWLARWIPTGNAMRPSIFQGLLAAVWFPLPFQWVWGGSNAAVWYLLFNVLPVCVVIWLARFRLRRVPFSL